MICVRAIVTGPVYTREFVFVGEAPSVVYRMTARLCGVDIDTLLLPV
jgi:hypothetical protein